MIEISKLRCGRFCLVFFGSVPVFESEVRVECSCSNGIIVFEWYEKNDARTLLITSDIVEMSDIVEILAQTPRTPNPSQVSSIHVWRLDFDMQDDLEYQTEVWRVVPVFESWCSWCSSDFGVRVTLVFE